MSALAASLGFIIIYIYAFIRRFYPKRLTVHLGYTILSVCVFPGKLTHNILRCEHYALPLNHRNTYNHGLTNYSQTENYLKKILKELSELMVTLKSCNHGVVSL